MIQKFTTLILKIYLFAAHNCLLPSARVNHVLNCRKQRMSCNVSDICYKVYKVGKVCDGIPVKKDFEVASQSSIAMI